MSSNNFPHDAEEPKPQPNNTMKITIRPVLILLLSAAVPGFSSCQTAGIDLSEVSRVSHAGITMN